MAAASLRILSFLCCCLTTTFATTKYLQEQGMFPGHAFTCQNVLYTVETAESKDFYTLTFSYGNLTTDSSVLPSNPEVISIIQKTNMPFPAWWEKVYQKACGNDKSLYVQINHFSPRNGSIYLTYRVDPTGIIDISEIDRDGKCAQFHFIGNEVFCLASKDFCRFDSNLTICSPARFEDDSIRPVSKGDFFNTKDRTYFTASPSVTAINSKLAYTVDGIQAKELLDLPMNNGYLNTWLETDFGFVAVLRDFWCCTTSETKLVRYDYRSNKLFVSEYSFYSNFGPMEFGLLSNNLAWAILRNGTRRSWGDVSVSLFDPNTLELTPLNLDVIDPVSGELVQFKPHWTVNHHVVKVKGVGVYIRGYHGDYGSQYKHSYIKIDTTGTVTYPFQELDEFIVTSGGVNRGTGTIILGSKNGIAFASDPVTDSIIHTEFCCKSYASLHFTSYDYGVIAFTSGGNALTFVEICNCTYNPSSAPSSAPSIAPTWNGPKSSPTVLTYTPSSSLENTSTPTTGKPTTTSLTSSPSAPNLSANTLNLNKVGDSDIAKVGVIAVSLVLFVLVGAGAFILKYRKTKSNERLYVNGSGKGIPINSTEASSMASLVESGNDNIKSNHVTFT